MLSWVISLERFFAAIHHLVDCLRMRHIREQIPRNWCASPTRRRTRTDEGDGPSNKRNSSTKTALIGVPNRICKNDLSRTLQFKVTLEVCQKRRMHDRAAARFLYWRRFRLSSFLRNLMPNEATKLASTKMICSQLGICKAWGNRSERHFHWAIIRLRKQQLGTLNILAQFIG
jgi:hypothetical protein